MADWIVTLAVVSFVIYKLGILTELDVGRGWLRLKFATPKAKTPRRGKHARN